MTHHLVGAAEIARLLGVSRQRVDQIASGYPDFPRPEAELAAGRVWSRGAVEGWMALHPGRKPGRRETPTLSLERLTDPARRVFVGAQEEARRFGHDYLGCEHLVLGLAREAGGPAGGALTAAGLTLEGARSSLRRLLAPGAGRADGPLPATKPVVGALEDAAGAALELGHDSIGPEHILLGLLQETGHAGHRVLVDAGVDPRALRLKLLEALGVLEPTSRADPVLLGELTRTRERLERLEQRLV